MLQLKLFADSRGKIVKHIGFDEWLELPCADGSSNAPGAHGSTRHFSVYQLSGIVVHLGGSTQSGHYTAFVKMGLNWYKMDDNTVTQVLLSTVLSQHAYILFYQKVVGVAAISVPEAVVEKERAAALQADVCCALCAVNQLCLLTVPLTLPLPLPPPSPPPFLSPSPFTPCLSQPKLEVRSVLCVLCPHALTL